MAERGGEGQATGAHEGTPDVFVSYASQDTAFADAIVLALESQGLKCWVAPRDVTPGEFYADAIVRALNAARIFVLVLTENAVTSPHVLREVERTSAKRHPIISFRIGFVFLPPALEYFLSASHWLDASNSGIDTALPKLVEAVQRLVAPPSAANPDHPEAVAKPLSEPLPPLPLRPPARQRLSRPIILLTAVIALGLTYVAADKFWFSKHTPNESTREAPIAAVTPAASPAAPAISEKSIAVLPFTDMSEKKDQEYFADGMAEEVINLLAKVPELYVPARTSSFYFKGKPTKISDIAHELGVAHVLEGSVRKSGNRLRVTAQLIRADNGYHVWSETYDRDFRDVFKVQDEIANAVVQALQISLQGGPLTRQMGGTENLEAYQLYLRAGNALDQNSKVSLEAARRDLEQATKLDPGFGLAWSSLAAHYLVATDSGLSTPQVGYERARNLAQQALQLSPGLAETHAILSYVYRSYDWDWQAAEAEWRRALVLDPRNSDALGFSGALYATLGRWNDADRQLGQAMAVDPLNPWRHLNRGIELYAAGRYAEAEASFRKVLEQAPAFISGHYYLAKALLAEGNAQAALVIARQETDEESRLQILTVVLQALGRKAEADEALQTLSTKFANSSAFYVAMVHAYRGDSGPALEWLDRAYRQKDIGLVEIVGEPLFKNLATDPRYKAFLRKMNLPE